ncbi:MAG: hypothetical protein KDD70_04425 [Bdellovibrionales bacterium]|nr:hypothetical protein [Bdellovibrionales bacterium]
METEFLNTVLRLLLMAIVPLTAIVVGCSMIGALLASVFSFRDESLQYALRFVGAVLAIVVLWSGVSSLLIQETRDMILYGF